MLPIMAYNTDIAEPVRCDLPLHRASAAFVPRSYLLHSNWGRGHFFHWLTSMLVLGSVLQVANT